MGTFFHKLKENHSIGFPRHIILYDTETYPTKMDRNVTKHNLKLGVLCYVRRKYKEHNQKEVWEDFDSIDDFWKLIEKYSQRKQTLYIFAHNQNFDFCVVDGLNELERRGWKIDRFIFEPSCFIVKAIKYLKKGDKFVWKWNSKKTKKIHVIDKTIMFCDTTNFIRCSVKYIGQVLGLPKLDVEFDNVTREQLRIYCKRDVEIIKMFLLRFIDFIEDRKLCYFKPTIAGLAFNAFRHSFMKSEIMVHANPQVIALERDSYRGGRTEAFWIGQFKSKKFYYLDINSQYPFVMRNNVYPTKLITYLNNPTIEELKANMKKHLVIAEVMIKVKEPYIAYREKRLLFPLGSFRVTLCSPEIEYVLEHGKILDVFKIALYESSNIFKDYVDYFYGIKRNDDKKYNALEIQATKLLLNSLYGKFGQKITPYKKEKYTESEGNFVERFYSIPLKKWFYNVVINGEVYRKGEIQEGRDSFVAIPSFVTAYARMYLWKLITQAKLENVYYTDTDSLIVNKAGRDRLKSFLSEKELGKLKLEKTTTDLEIKGVKNYKFGKEIKIKGIKRNAKKIGENTFNQENFMSIKSQMGKGLFKGSHSVSQNKTLKGDYLKGVVDEKGKVHPFIYEEGVRIYG